MVGFLAGLGSFAGGIGSGLLEGEQLQNLQLQRQAQAALGRAALAGQMPGAMAPVGTGAGALASVSPSPYPQIATAPGQASAPIQRTPLPPPSNQNGPYGNLAGAISPAAAQKIAYIRQAAAARGIDPNIAVRVAQSEGLSGAVGDQGSSFGPFQLHVGGIAPGGNAVAGLGDAFKAQTGLDPADPKNWQATVNFALDNAKQHGWGAFHGAGRAGIAPFEGIANAQAQSAQQPQPAQMPANQFAPLQGIAQQIVQANPGIQQKPGLLWMAMQQAYPMMAGEQKTAFNQMTQMLKLQLAQSQQQNKFLQDQITNHLKEAKLNQPKYMRTGTDAMGQPQYGWVNPQTQQVQGAQGGPQGGAPSDAEQGLLLHGKALDAAAETYAQTGQLPNLGFAGPVRVINDQAIINQAFKLHPNLKAADLPSQWRQYKAAESGGRSLSNRATMLASTSYEMQHMIPIVTQTAAQVPLSQYPTLNKVLQAAQLNVGGPNVTRLAQAVQSLSYMYARALNPTGRITDADKNAAMHVLNQYWSKGQIAGGLALMQQEVAAMESGLREAQTRYTKTGSATPGPKNEDGVPSSSAAPAKGSLPKGNYRYNPTTGQLEPIK